MSSRKPRPRRHAPAAKAVARSSRASRTRIGLVSLVLVAATVAAYSPIAGNDFVSFDDTSYVTDNPHVLGGLTIDGLKWAFTTGHASNWHPLTWLSLMLDAQLFGRGALGFHLVNLLFHTIASVLLLLALFRMTGALLPSAGVAFVFALHPLHVESVAWVAERKDVLSAVFAMLTVLAYLTHVRAPSAPRFAIVAVLFALGLMAKPILVALPLVLLLLDYWPLSRIAPRSPASSAGDPAARASITERVREKWPLFALAAACAVVTFAVQRQGGAVAGLAEFSIARRMGNAAIACVAYLAKTLWPARLAFFYPYPAVAPSPWQSGGAALLVALVTAGAIQVRKRAPYVTVGWFWYLVTLLPVLGLVQVGEQSMADRYTYLPMIGLAIAAAWTVAELRPRSIVIVVGSMVLLACGVLTHTQVGTWRNDRTLAEQALRVTRGNFKAHNLLGLDDERRGDLEGALAHYSAAVALAPNSERHFNLANTYRALGVPDSAIVHYEEALRLDPSFAPALNNLGGLYFEREQWDRAADCFVRSARVEPNQAEPHFNLGLVLERQGLRDRALLEYRQALRLAPDFAAARKSVERLESAGG